MKTNTKNISDMKTNQIKRQKSINVIFSNVNAETNSQTLKILLPEQLENVKRQKKEDFY